MRVSIILGSILLILMVVSSCRMGGDRSPDLAIGQPIETLYSGPEIPEFLEVDERYVFWTSRGQDRGAGRPTWNLRLMRMDKDGSDLKTLVAEMYAAWNMTTDAEHIYWIGPEGIKKIPKDGGVVVKLVAWPIPDDLTQDFDLAVDGTHIYWASCLKESIWKVDKNGSVPVKVLTGACPSAIVPQGDYLYWIQRVIRVGRILRMAKDGSQMIELATHQDWPQEMVCDERMLYWINTTDPEYHGEYAHGAVMSQPLRGGTLTKLASVNIPDHLAVDDRFIYWVSSTGLQKLQKEGGTVMTVTTVQNVVEDLAVDDKRLYFTVPNERAVYAVNKE